MKNSNKPAKINLSSSDRGLKAVAAIITSISLLFILFPFVLTMSNAMKDNVKIYDVPPKLLPDPVYSMSLVVDYTTSAGNDEELNMSLQNDMISAMFGIYSKMDRESIFEIKFYGLREGKTIFYSRAHQIHLQMEKDYGIYQGTVLSKDTLLYKDRAQRAASALGYEYNPQGLPDRTAPEVMETQLAEKLDMVLAGDFCLNGLVTACTLKQSNLLLFESFLHYMQLPEYIYGDNPKIAQFGFWTFVANTMLVIGFAMVSQVLLCSVCGFVISRLMTLRAGRIALLYFLGAMMIPFVSIMLPQLMMYREMGAYNNYAALLLPFLYPFGFFVYLFKGFFDQIPGSYFEAARLDGASNLYLYSRICMPLSKPIISLIALQVFLGNWNDFFWAWIVTEKQDLWTLNVALYTISNNAGTKQNALMGIALVTILPVIVLCLCFSKQLKASIMASGVKG